jgi:hypothetical protein
MEYELLPPELEHLERILAGGPRANPPAALEARVLGGVRSALRRRRIVRRWLSSAAFAATIFVAITLSPCVLQATGLAPQQSEPSVSIEEIARRLQQLAPRLTREDSLRQAALREIGADANCQTPLGDVTAEYQAHDS